MSKQRTLEHPLVGTWPLEDEVVGLRLFGADRTHSLSAGPSVRTLGAHAKCDIVLRDASGTILARHAKLVRDRAGWTLRALDSAARVSREHTPLREFPLVPGLSIGIGNVRLVVESLRTQVLRRALARLLGAGAEQRHRVDRALGTVLRTASGLGTLTLCGEGNLVAVARRLHSYTLGDQPFVVCDPRRGSRMADVRSGVNVDDPMRALAAAAGGSLCVVTSRLPRNFDAAFERLQTSPIRVQLILCGATPDRILMMTGDPVIVTPLAPRPRDRARIINEIAAEAAEHLGLDAPRLSPADRHAILAHDGDNVPGLEKATLRTVVLRNRASVAEAARQLGMTQISLSKWAASRGLLERGR